jgi:Peptidase family U32
VPGAREFLTAAGLPAADEIALVTSEARFPDGGQFRIEIPSTEGPEALEAVIDEADKRDVSIHRVSQGSGVMLQTDDELRRLNELGDEHGIEVSLFTGPRASWDIGAQATSPAGRAIAGSLRGANQLVYGIEDVRHACELGLRSFLVADIGQLWCLGWMKEAGDLPADLVLKVSVALPVANPATARVMEELGATTLNLPVDLTVSQIGAIRQAVRCPLDIYVEAPDDFGAPLRYYDIPDIVRVAAPVYLKFTVRNSPGLYPSGGHIRTLALESARERVRRAEIGLSMLRRYMPEAKASPKQ